MSLSSDLSARLRAFFLRGREEREMAEEFRFHVDMATEHFREAGDSESEARRKSLLAFGGMERYKEETRDARGTRLIEDTLADVGLAARGLRHNPRFALVAILTLAIGVGGTTAVFSAVDAVLLKPLPYEEAGQLARIYSYQLGSESQLGFVSGPHYGAYRSDLSSFDGVAAISTYSQLGADIGTGVSAERIRILPVSADYFGVMRAQPVLGRAFQRSEETDAPLVILSYRLWQRLLSGRQDVLGTALVMSGVPRTIVGVMPKGYLDPIVGEVDALTPLDLRAIGDRQDPGNHYLTVLGRVRGGVPLSQAQAELDVLGKSISTQYHSWVANTRAHLTPLKEDVVGSASGTLELMLGAVAIVLLLVCVNLANLLLVRGSERTREFALRAALGAERRRLIRQLLTESVALALVGGLAGLALARAMMPAIVALGAGSIPRLDQLSLDWPVLAFTFVIASASAVLFGLVPALAASRTQPAEVMREQSQATTSTRSLGRLRSTLVISQVALAFLLLIGAGLLLVSVDQLRRTDLGVVADNVLTFELNLPSARYDSTARGLFYDAFAREMEAIPGVRRAGGVSKLPATGDYHSWGIMALSGPNAGMDHNSFEAQQRVVSGDYFQAVGIRLLRGRLFDDRDAAGAQHRLVVGARLAQEIFPGVDPIGQMLLAGGDTSVIIGVVNDVAVNAEGRTVSMVYHAHRQFAGNRNWSLMQVVSTNGPPASVVPAIRRLLARLDPQLVPYQPTALDEVIGRGRAQRVFTLRILVTFAGVAILLAAIGLFGVLSYAVRLRSREIGIRMALGADRWSIRGMVLRDGAIVTAIGVAVGLGGAVALSKVIAAMVFHVSPLDPAVLLGAVVFMVIVAGLAAYLPARRASSVAPQSVLQGE